MPAFLRECFARSQLKSRDGSSRLKTELHLPLIHLKEERAARSQNFFHFTGGELMISRTWSRKSIAFCLAIAVLSIYSMVSLAAPGQQGPAGEVSVSGKVNVNGQSAISGATIFSDSTIVTAPNSSAVVSLGKLG